ncbi:MAG: metallophosphoesterase [Lachnospiraceae bacterium]|nr:metallophosphoesterase [Lachnospiraceae bacterium]
MGLFAIGDLHLSGFKPKPMDIFGTNWHQHQKKIEDNWCKIITEDDTILIPGDISWGLNLCEAKCDLDFLAQLPGKKLLLRGNHDYWWGSVSRLNSMYEKMYFIQNDYVEYNGKAVCGSRGWTLPNEQRFDANDIKTYKRELIRCRLSLERAAKNKYEEIVFMMHFPPAMFGATENAFVDILKEYPVKTVVYGHLHGMDNFAVGIKGIHDGIEYHLVSSDFLDFCPKKIM